mmetsp:Transcript_29486/g.52994  ORF Transcript_29486/g.52994 Transcript_29486/m.52994 type:complete len:207 (+) Transcript_29486:790-1410(+)
MSKPVSSIATVLASLSEPATSTTRCAIVLGVSSAAIRKIALGCSTAHPVCRMNIGLRAPQASSRTSGPPSEGAGFRSTSASCIASPLRGNCPTLKMRGEVHDSVTTASIMGPTITPTHSSGSSCTTSTKNCGSLSRPMRPRNIKTLFPSGIFHCTRRIEARVSRTLLHRGMPAGITMARCWWSLGRVSRPFGETVTISWYWAAWRA